jgi:DNA-binding FadR family transcriptional regulator
VPELQPVSDPAFDHGLRRQAIVRAILTDIFHGKYRAGQRLVTEALANRFGVSHTPIREVLVERHAPNSRLSAMDLLLGKKRGAITILKGRSPAMGGARESCRSVCR